MVARWESQASVPPLTALSQDIQIGSVIGVISPWFAILMEVERENDVSLNLHITTFERQYKRQGYISEFQISGQLFSNFFCRVNIRCPIASVDNRSYGKGEKVGNKGKGNKMGNLR